MKKMLLKLFFTLLQDKNFNYLESNLLNIVFYSHYMRNSGINLYRGEKCFNNIMIN